MMMKDLVSVLGLGAILLICSGPVLAQDPEGRTQTRMKAMDTNADGLVTLSEFVEYRRSWSSKRDDAELQMRPEVVKRAFDRIDTDGDGSISFAELLVNTKASQARK